MRASRAKIIRLSRRWRGAALVEMAIILPLLMLIVLGCVDFGRFIYSHIAVTNASRTGAHFGAVNPPTIGTMSNWQAQIRQRVADDLGVANNAALVTDIPTPINDGGGLWRTHVRVTYPFETIVTWPGIPHRMNLTSTTEMRGLR